MSAWSHGKRSQGLREATGGRAGAQQLLQGLSALLGTGRLVPDCRDRRGEVAATGCREQRRRPLREGLWEDGSCEVQGKGRCSFGQFLFPSPSRHPFLSDALPYEAER